MEAEVFNVLDVRFADDLLLFARTKFQTICMLEILMEELACVGLCLNAVTTLVLTNEAPPPKSFTLTNHEEISVKGNDVGHKSFRCILSAGAEANLEHHLSFIGRFKGVLCQQTNFL